MSVYGGKRHFIYLAGNISNDPETYHWRERFEDYMDDINRMLVEHGYADDECFICMNPCDNAFNAKWKENINILRHEPSDHLGLLMPKDFHMVKLASIIVINLHLWTPEKPMFGSVVEQVWSYRDVKPIMGITGDNNSPYVNHQWSKDMCSTHVKDEKEAALVIAEFFAPGPPRRERRAKDTVWD